MYWNLVLFFILGTAVILTAFFLYASFLWEAETERMRRVLKGGRTPVTPKTYDPEELKGLPDMVQRYFKTVLTAGQPMIAAATVEHTGTFNIAESGEKWQRFTSDQLVITRHPGFDWDARIQMLPGIEVRVHDAYIAGEGIMHAALLGLVPLAKMRGASEMARGQLMRYFAEAAWYPTALLPSQGVTWEALDQSSARATLIDGNITLSMVFRFDAGNLIEAVRADSRGRTVGDDIIPTPWEGRWRNYELRHGMLIPLEGEVAWLLEEGPKPYWRGRITRLAYEFSR